MWVRFREVLVGIGVTAPGESEKTGQEQYNLNFGGVMGDSGFLFG